MANILIGVSGGIACYKIPSLCRLFKREGHDVKVILTENASKFVTPLTFESVTGNRAYTGEFDPGLDPEIIEHIELAGWADKFIIAPATANTVAKAAQGIADNLLASTLLVYTKPAYFVPAMNTNMFNHPATQNNLRILAERGNILIEPDSGELACGTSGKGRMKEPEELFRLIEGERPLAGLRVLVTAGATVEPIDPVRYISNYSSGKMGLAVALKARELGAEVKIIAGSISADCSGFDTVRVKSAEDMLKAVKENIGSCDILIKAAAVADYAPVEAALQKIKKSEGELVIRLKKNPDILKEIAPLKKHSQVFCGFAAESENLNKNAIRKLNEKKLDMIVANDISRKDIGFGSDDNEADIFFADGSSEHFDKGSKKKLAELILIRAAGLLK
jgi:phosphopantothenoylcysteine decarboxylase/phosphopantothenate--cysteine ligase